MLAERKPENPEWKANLHPLIQKFLDEDGRDLEIHPSECEVKSEKAYDYQALGRVNVSIMREFINKLRSWLSSPVIFDNFNVHWERWEFEEKMNKKYGPIVKNFLKRNRINQDTFIDTTERIEEFLSDQIQKLDALYPFKFRPLMGKAKNLYHEFRNIIIETERIESVGSEIRKRLRDNVYFKSMEISKIPDTDEPIRIPQEIIREKLMLVAASLEKVCQDILKCFEKKRKK